MYRWIMRLMIARGVRCLNAGDIGPLLSGYSKYAVLVFPGDHSWTGPLLPGLSTITRR